MLSRIHGMVSKLHGMFYGMVRYIYHKTYHRISINSPAARAEALRCWVSSYRRGSRAGCLGGSVFRKASWNFQVTLQRAAPNEAPVTGAPRMSMNSFRSPCRLDTPAPAQDLWQRWPVPQRCVDGAPHCTTSQIWIWVLGSGGPQIDSPWLVVEGEP